MARAHGSSAVFRMARFIWAIAHWKCACCIPTRAPNLALERHMPMHTCMCIFLLAVLWFFNGQIHLLHMTFGDRVLRHTI
eukprot:scaffold314306_cov43-Tisochrysis_lutea.AAC.1